ncbi:Protein fluG [Psilocybe cubensis]|uniref:Protein fluG n=2 Tax=Psilocybe cubensis TaxID=181762 RepID=A0ACB8GT05_PSICU|nr:Protein fluG [Psilocybe cubensis]KAH9478711.1 Protein fluG [Psilocybe cubensis]
MNISSNIGVDYKASSLDLGVIHPSSLQGSDIKFIRLQWLDYTNMVKFRIMPVSYFQKLLASQRPGVNLAKPSLGLVGLGLAEGFPIMGEYYLTPDVRTLRRCPYEPGHASLMSWFEEKAPVELPDGSSSVAVPLCPRTTLKRIVDCAENESHVKFLVGFESEFVLLKSTDPIEAVNIHEFSSSDSMRPGAIETTVMNEIAKSVQESGIELQLYHAEAGAGQYEVVTGPLPPLESADALVHTREIIYNTAARYGLRATFTPRLPTSAIGSAAHMHLSIHSTVRTPSPKHPLHTPKAPNVLSPLESTFLAGLLAHLPALPALTLPTAASYQRVGDGRWSGGTYVCWGTENREAPVRLTNPASPSSRRFELRFMDGTANPYLALAGIIGAGHAGVRAGLKLEVQDNPGPQSAAQMSPEERAALGIVRRMPLSWEEGRKNIQSDRELVVILGEELVEKYLSVNKLVDSTINNPEASESERIQSLIKFY